MEAAIDAESAEAPQDVLNFVILSNWDRSLTNDPRSRRISIPITKFGIHKQEIAYLRLQQKLSTLHDLLAIHPDIKVPSHHIDMRGGIPLSAGVHAIRIAEGDVCSRVLFILENLSDHILQLDISANGELAHNIAVLIRVGVSPEVGLQFTVGRVRLRETITLYLNR